MRPLMMDFPSDPNALDVGDEFLFGPALLVAPLTRYKARSRSVYLPAGQWYDFWSGARLAGGQTIEAPAPYDSMPLYVRAGSILPMGPDIQHTGEKTDPITLRVYEGADSAFTLYEDDGVSYEYERGARAEIPIRWDQAGQTLTIGRRRGSFAGSWKERTFEVAFVSSGSKRTLRYRGETISTRP
jgi:alpha-D-xyloside xylohydrolase